MVNLSLSHALNLDIDEAFARARQLDVVGLLMPSVVSVESLVATTRGQVMQRVDRWTARVTPRQVFGRSFSEATWTVSSLWDASRWTSDWEVTVNRPENAAHSRGRLLLTPGVHGVGTIASLDGVLTVEPKAVGLGFGPVAAAVRPIAERMLGTLIEQNLRALLNEMDDQATAPRPHFMPLSTTA